MRKIQNFLILLLISLFTATFSIATLAQVAKHPRVSEVESQLTKDALTFLQGRFPGIPLMVNVEIDPLRRIPDSAQKNKEQLPYYMTEDEEIRDEWDDPTLPTKALLNRVKKAVITVSVPSQLNDEETLEIKENLRSVLHLTPARDEIIIHRRTWSIDQNHNGWIFFSAFAFLAITFLFGLFFINRSSTSKLVHALNNQKPAQAPMEQSQMQAPMKSVEKNESKDISKNGQIKFNDPLRLREVVIESIRSIESDPCFPTLEDMILLDMLGKLSARSLGSVLIEFSNQTQEKLFALSFNDWWLEAFNNPGEISPESLEIVLRLGRTHRYTQDSHWQKLLIAIWRLGNNRISFIKSLEKADSFVILRHLPKSVSVAVARAAYPGNWAGVIEGDSLKAEIPEMRIEKILNEAVRLAPPRDLKLLSRYKSDKDLLDYLRGVDVREEKEIYGAAPKDSIIHRMRPPFYPIFDFEEQDLRLVMQAVSMDEWALAMFNTLKTDRKKVESQFSDKMKILFIEKLKYLDANPPMPEEIGYAREKIGKIVHAITETNAKAKLAVPIQLDSQKKNNGGESAA